MYDKFFFVRIFLKKIDKTDKNVIAGTFQWHYLKIKKKIFTYTLYLYSKITWVGLKKVLDESLVWKVQFDDLFLIYSDNKPLLTKITILRAEQIVDFKFLCLAQKWLKFFEIFMTLKLHPFQ